MKYHVLVLDLFVEIAVGFGKYNIAFTFTCQSVADAQRKGHKQPHAMFAHRVRFCSSLCSHQQTFGPVLQDGVCVRAKRACLLACMQSHTHTHTHARSHTTASYWTFADHIPADMPFRSPVSRAARRFEMTRFICLGFDVLRGNSG